MGGNAFSNNEITMTRIDDQLYQQVAYELEAILGHFYRQVLFPPSAPGKVDHGDIDFLVSELKGTQDVEVENAIAKQLNAAAVFRNGAMTSYAVPHPQRIGQHVQVDIQLCKPDYLPWLYFITSYGDLVPILGSIHHKFGLTINDKGLWVHLDLPKAALTCGVPRSEMTIFVTLDADKMMEFMGLDAAAYRKGFSTEEEIFDWIASGKYFRPVLHWTSTLSDGRAKQDETADTSKETQTTKRRMLARFGSYSQSRPAGPLAKSTPTAVAFEAVTFFDKRKHYDTQMAYCLSEVQDFDFWQQVRATFPGSSSRKARIIRSLKKWVIVEDGEMRIGLQAVEQSRLSRGSKQELQGRLNWIAENWEEAYQREKTAGKKKAVSGNEKTCGGENGDCCY
ncbi:hypothetical protein NliqN6_4574 [Naganishia liquefaciens]|uniref:Uncharacterized protein n=1 Tax=Naganishia liquefaciens TaxID=104408 RepID=A0A8H3TW13_9TREE|nr:hypothetical protein NliqN6_4574 [Naganishia liquefaciens]